MNYYDPHTTNDIAHRKCQSTMSLLTTIKQRVGNLLVFYSLIRGPQENYDLL